MYALKTTCHTERNPATNTLTVISLGYKIEVIIGSEFLKAFGP